ncbi:hypothetical protein GCM10027035_47650 [Emticicia sediminis]
MKVDFGLDSIMMKKIETLSRLTMILNTSEKKAKAQIQIGHSRLILSVQHYFEGYESFPLYTFQRSYRVMSHPDLDEAIEEINNYIKYADK